MTNALNEARAYLQQLERENEEMRTLLKRLYEDLHEEFAQATSDLAYGKDVIALRED